VEIRSRNDAQSALAFEHSTAPNRFVWFFKVLRRKFAKINIHFSREFAAETATFVAATLKQLVNLNDAVADSKAVEPRWKILIFDQYGQDIISPLLTVKDLRDLGVTLHL